MRYFTRNLNAFACCCSLLLLPLGGLADVERGAPEAPAKAPIHQHQQHHPHQQPQSVKLHQPAVPSSAAYHQPAPGTGAAQHPDGPAPQQPVHYHQQAAPAAAATSASQDRSLSRQPPSSLAATSAPPRPLETRNSYTVLSQAMSQAVHHEFGMYRYCNDPVRLFPVPHSSPPQVFAFFLSPIFPHLSVVILLFVLVVLFFFCLTDRGRAPLSFPTFPSHRSQVFLYLISEQSRKQPLPCHCALLPLYFY